MGRKLGSRDKWETKWKGENGTEKKREIETLGNCEK